MVNGIHVEKLEEREKVVLGEFYQGWNPL